MSDFHESTAILVDGAFYRKRANYLFGEKRLKNVQKNYLNTASVI